MHSQYQIPSFPSPLYSFLYKGQKCTLSWESLFPAVRADLTGGVYANVNAIRPIDHAGAHFQVTGPLSMPTGRFGRVPVFRASASAEGRAFAACHSDAVFAAAPTQEAAHELRADLYRLAEPLRTCGCCPASEPVPGRHPGRSARPVCTGPPGSGAWLS